MCEYLSAQTEDIRIILGYYYEDNAVVTLCKVSTLYEAMHSTVILYSSVFTLITGRSNIKGTWLLV